MSMVTLAYSDIHVSAIPTFLVVLFYSMRTLLVASSGLSSIPALTARFGFLQASAAGSSCLPPAPLQEGRTGFKVLVPSPSHCLQVPWVSQLIESFLAMFQDSAQREGEIAFCLQKPTTPRSLSDTSKLLIN
jgi:hypothetical protein